MQLVGNLSLDPCHGEGRKQSASTRVGEGGDNEKGGGVVLSSESWGLEVGGR